MKIPGKGTCGRETSPTRHAVHINQLISFLGLLTRKTVNGSSTGSGSTGWGSTRWRWTGRRGTNSVCSRRGNGTLTDDDGTRGRSYHFARVTSHRGAWAAIRRRRRRRTSRWFRRPVSHWLEFTRTGWRHICADAQWHCSDSSDHYKSSHKNGEASTQFHTLQRSPKRGLHQNPRFPVPKISVQ